MDGREPPRGYWELNHGPLREQQMLLIAEPTLQPVIFIIFSYVCGCVCLRMQCPHRLEVGLLEVELRRL